MVYLAPQLLSSLAREGDSQLETQSMPHPVPPHVARFLVREAASSAGAYRLAGQDRASVVGTLPSAPNPGPAGDPSVPDPFDDAEALEELEEEIATLAAHIHAATHRLLTLIAEFDRRRGWELGGHRSCAHWLHVRTGIDLGAAREKVRTARALGSLPLTGASMARGELSFSKVRALSRVATQANEGELLAFARGCTTAQLERMVRGFRRGSREDEAAWELQCYESRTLSVFPDEDGMYVVKGRLPAEVGALLMRAVEAAGDALFREKKVRGLKAGPGWSEADTGMGREASPPQPTTDTRREAAQRRADALALLAERALAAGFGGRASARAERYQVVLHVEAETLEADGEPGRSELDDGTRVSAETSRRLSCDAGLVRITHAPDGSVLDAGRRTRTISPALRRALEARDQGCRFPGCGLRFTDAHHVKHWAEGGQTSLGNTLLLCHHHHRLVHEGGWRVGWSEPGRPMFLDPRGGPHFDGRWRPPEPAWEATPSKQPTGPAEAKQPTSPLARHPSAAALMAQNHRRGVRPDGWTAAARWKREADIPDRVYFRALEAVHEAGP